MSPKHHCLGAYGGMCALNKGFVSLQVSKKFALCSWCSIRWKSLVKVVCDGKQVSIEILVSWGNANWSYD